MVDPSHALLQRRPSRFFWHDARVIVRLLRSLIRHLEKQQIRQLLRAPVRVLACVYTQAGSSSRLPVRARTQTGHRGGRYSTSKVSERLPKTSWSLLVPRVYKICSTTRASISMFIFVRAELGITLFAIEFLPAIIALVYIGWPKARRP